MAKISLQPIIPLQLESDGSFKTIEDSSENIKQKFRMLILTNPGEKLMNPTFGVGIRNFLFENQKVRQTFTIGITDNVEAVTQEDIEEKIKSIIIAQCNAYLREITILDVLVNFEENTMFLTVNYTINGLINNSLDLVIT
jgi:phage baseplate assembly protein W